MKSPHAGHKKEFRFKHSCIEYKGSIHFSYSLKRSVMLRENQLCVRVISPQRRRTTYSMFNRKAARCLKRTKQTKRVRPSCVTLSSLETSRAVLIRAPRYRRLNHPPTVFFMNTQTPPHTLSRLQTVWDKTNPLIHWLQYELTQIQLCR